MSHLNCWEYFQCGREPGGKNVAEKGVCPATTFQSADGTNHGVAAGRFCWVVKGTLCEHITEKMNKLVGCLKCPFYLEVEREEDRFFVACEKMRPE